MFFLHIFAYEIKVPEIDIPIENYTYVCLLVILGIPWKPLFLYE